MNFSQKSRAIALKALDLTIKNGGCTLDPKTNEEVTTGYAVGGIREFKFHGASVGHIDEVTEAIAKIRVSHPKTKIGFWLDGSTLYVDAVAVMNSEESARTVGEAFDELCIFHLDTKREIWLGDDGFDAMMNHAEEQEEIIQQMTREAND